MSTARNAAIDRAAETIRHFDTTQDLIRNIAIAVVNTLYPEILDARQMIGVPEGSIVIVSGPTFLERPLTWYAGNLHGRLPGVMDPVKPEFVIEHYGPLTVVWMP
jgi:hypothetical protein